MNFSARCTPWLASVVLLLFLLTPLSWSSSLKTAPTGKRKEQIRGKHGVVATDDGRCSKVGRDVLREGGHAVDAAVAAALCLGVVSPASSGIGGGAFLIVRSADGKAQAFDMREAAPKRASQVHQIPMYRPDDLFLFEKFGSLASQKIELSDLKPVSFAFCTEYVLGK